MRVSASAREFCRTMVLLALLMIPVSVFCQPPVLIIADTFPAVPQKYTWLFHQPDHLVYRYDYKGEWRKMYEHPVTKVWTCNAIVVIELNKGFVQFFGPSGGLEGSCDLQDFICRDSVAGEIGRHIELIDNRPNHILNDGERHLSQFLYGNCGVGKSETIRGMEAYCLPQEVPYEAKMIMVECNELHNWGMLGVNAEWLIAPIFDEPFHFHNGFAIVVHYGQKRKINEKGEFVDSLNRRSQ